MEFEIIYLAVEEARFDEHLSLVVPRDKPRTQAEHRGIRPEFLEPIGDGLKADPKAVAPEDKFFHVFQGVKAIVESERVEDQLQRIDVVFVNEGRKSPPATLALIELDGFVLLLALPFFDYVAASAKGTGHDRLGFGQRRLPEGWPRRELGLGDGLRHIKL